MILSLVAFIAVFVVLPMLALVLNILMSTNKR